MRLLTHSSLLEVRGFFLISRLVFVSFKFRFYLTNMMLPFAVFVLQILWGCDGCFPTRSKVLTNSYVPVAVQILHHYKTQLQDYLPYTAACEFGRKGSTPPAVVLSTDVCVDESLRRINLFLIDLQREAMKGDLENFQGFGQPILAELEKTSHLTSIQQLHFILKKLEKENFGNEGLKCKIIQFLNDLENINSKLYRNLLNVKPLNYLH